MIINESEIKMLSRIGSRAAFGMAALDLGESIDNLIIVSAGTSTSAGLDRFKKFHPNKHVDVGIAEQNMMGVAAGLASEGFNVITTTFAPFQIMRCCEQIRVNLGYMGYKVCMVGLASGVALGVFGYTHCCIEDVSVLRATPGIAIVSPADCTETVKATLAAVNYPTSVYIRLTGDARSAAVYKEDYDFKIGKAITLREGNDIVIIATGSMVYESLQAAILLSKQGISAAVINMHTIKPLDTAIIDKACVSSRLIATVEEHSVIGGLGSAVADYQATLKKSPPQILIGLPDKFGQAGEYRYLLEKHGLFSGQIAEKIVKQYEKT